MARWNRARVSTAAAVLLHGLCIAAAASLPDAPRLWMRPLQRIEPLVELEIEVEPSPARELAATGEGRRIASVASLQPGQRPAEAAEPPEAEPLGLEPEASEPAPEPAPERRRPTLAEIGVGTPPPFRLVELERAPTRKQALARRVDQMLAAGLAERDLERGHGAHGSVMSALETASFSARTPERGSALFMARIEQR